LSEGQQQMLTKLRDQTAARIEDYKRRGLTWTSITNGQIEFEARQTSALMLQQSLVEKAGDRPQRTVRNTPPRCRSSSTSSRPTRASRSTSGDHPTTPER